MFCRKCGNELPQGAKFCDKCGTKVVVERRCTNCNTLLGPDDIFCTECGTRYAGNANTGMQDQKTTQAPKTTQAQNITNERSQSFAPKTESYCVNTIKGRIAILDNNLYFIGTDSTNKNADRDLLCSVSLNNGEKARVILNKFNFFRTILSSTISLKIKRLHAWNGKLYFSALVEFGKENKPITDDIYPFTGIFSFCPKTNKLEVVKSFRYNYETMEIFFHKNNAYYLKYMDEESGKLWEKALEAKFGKQKDLYYWNKGWYKLAHALITLDLVTSQETSSFMPMIAMRDWKGDNTGNGIIERKWNSPIFYNGYIYASIQSSCGYSLRFPVNNPESYEFLPLNTVIYCNSFGIELFAACNDVIILPVYDDKLCAISQSTLHPINNFQEHKFYRSDNWQIYGGNYLTCKGIMDSYAKVFDITNAKYLGNTDARYCDKEMYDNIYFNNYTYAFGRFYDGRQYNGLALYRIPWDKMFRKDTNIDDFAQPLF